MVGHPDGSLRIDDQQAIRAGIEDGFQARLAGLQLQQSLGSFEKGKRPGVVLIEGLKDGNIAEASTAKPVL